MWGLFDKDSEQYLGNSYGILEPKMRSIYATEYATVKEAEHALDQVKDRFPHAIVKELP
jgi:hypothetical protein